MPQPRVLLLLPPAEVFRDVICIEWESVEMSRNGYSYPILAIIIGHASYSRAASVAAKRRNTSHLFPGSFRFPKILSNGKDFGVF